MSDSTETQFHDRMTSVLSSYILEKLHLKSGDTHATADFIEYKKRVASAKKYTKKCKVDNFRKFAESINFETNVTYIWKKCRTLKNK